MRALYGSMAKFFDDETGSYRVFVRRNPFKGTGGTGLARSFTFGYNFDAKPTVDSLQGLLAHEMAHTWPAMQGEHGDTAWYSEGTAEYYSTVLSFRSLTPGDKGPNIDAIRVLDDGPSDSCRQGGYRAVGPVRLLDTRPESVVGYEGGKPGAGAEVRVQISGREGIPTGLAAVVVNLTATAADDAGFVTAWASGTERPFTSSLNIDRPGQTRPNHAIVPVGQDGAITLYTLNGTHLVVDVFGYFTG